MASDSSHKTIFAAMGANLAIAITKFIAASITGSSAMISEGIHSVVDTGDQLVLLLAGLARLKPY
ncbi:cation transporter [Nostoc sp.]|uniref:cation transporter n=1 Tax=Nostoc sp. TaxID=1180 RepID=UPI002FF9A10B